MPKRPGVTVRVASGCKLQLPVESHIRQSEGGAVAFERHSCDRQLNGDDGPGDADPPIPKVRQADPLPSRDVLRAVRGKFHTRRTTGARRASGSTSSAHTWQHRCQGEIPLRPKKPVQTPMTTPSSGAKIPRFMSGSCQSPSFRHAVSRSMSMEKVPISATEIHTRCPIAKYDEMAMRGQ